MIKTTNWIRRHQLVAFFIIICDGMWEKLPAEYRAVYRGKAANKKIKRHVDVNRSVNLVIKEVMS